MKAVAADLFSNMMRLHSIFLENSNISAIGESFLKNQHLIVRVNLKHNECVDEDFFTTFDEPRYDIFDLLKPCFKN